MIAPLLIARSQRQENRPRGRSLEPVRRVLAGSLLQHRVAAGVLAEPLRDVVDEPGCIDRTATLGLRAASVVRSGGHTGMRNYGSEGGREGWGSGTRMLDPPHYRFSKCSGADSAKCGMVCLAGGVSPLLIGWFEGGSLGFPLSPFESCQVIAGLRGRFGGASLLHLRPATFTNTVQEPPPVRPPPRPPPLELQLRPVIQSLGERRPPFDAPY